MSKFLITGGAGFIGGNFCDYMVNAYPEDMFICLDAQLLFPTDICILEISIQQESPSFGINLSHLSEKEDLF